MVNINRNKINPTKKIIDATKMQVLYFPLESTLGYKYKPIAKVGDYVCVGDILANNIAADFPLLSSVSGTIVGFEEKYISSSKKVKCYVIENDFKEKYKNKPGKKLNLSEYSKESFLNLLRECAVSGMSGSDYPTYLKYDNKELIDYLIVNGCECDSYCSSDSSIMYNYPEEILSAIDAMLDILNIKKAYIAISSENDKVIKKILRYINTYPNIKIYQMTTGYPNGWEKNLVEVITGRTYNHTTIEAKTIVNNVSTIYSIYEALKYKKPVVDRLITLSGPGIKKEGIYKVKIGTNLSELILKTNEYRNLHNPVLLSGGSMRGKSIPNDELIITKDTHTILVLENYNEATNPCLKCGKCSEVCPVGLMPSLIINRPKKHKLKLEKCINCGLCSYVCPSKIEVLEILNHLKEDNNERV